MMNNSETKETIAVIFGGANSEHEVSRRSVTSILENINREKYNIVMVGITKEGKWYYYNGKVEDIVNGDWEKSQEKYPAIISPDTSHHGLLILKENSWEIKKIDVIFPVMHGKNAEDGTIQGLFEIAGIPYVGCGVGASSNCMDKEYTHILLESGGVKTAKWAVAKKKDLENFDETEKFMAEKLRYPMFVKPANAGSSVGVSKAKNKEELKKAIENALIHDKKVIVEEFIKGKEIECAVMGNDEPFAPATGELEIRSEFYDYESKYINDSTSIHIPARISEEDSLRIRETAVKAYKILGCQGLTRVDFFLCDDGKIILLEPNTMPGFTSISMYPKLIMQSGMSYSDIIDKLIFLAKER